VRRVNNAAASTKPNLYANLAAEWWSVVGELIERRKILLPDDEKLVAQLTSRRKLYDSKGRTRLRLESKADMRARGLELLDRAGAIIGAIMLSTPGQSGGLRLES
jgi:hypothetical protein